MGRLKILLSAFLLLVMFEVSAMAQFFGECRVGSDMELARNIRSHAEHTFRMEDKFLHTYYKQGRLPHKFQAPTIENVQRYLHLLSKRQAAVLFYAYDEKEENLCTWLISAQKINSHKAKVKNTDIRYLQSRLMRDLDVTSRAATRAPMPKNGKGSDHVSQHGEGSAGGSVEQATSMLLPKSIGQVLLDRHIDTLIVVPIYQIGTIPFSVLRIGDRPLVDNISLLTAPGFDVFMDKQLPAPRDFSRSVIVGDPDYDDPEYDPDPLPGARAEAVEVGRIVGSRPLIGPNAKIENIKKLLETDKKNPGLIFLATHAYADTENPLDGSWIWLSREDNRFGRWTPRDIQYLPLKEGRPLVVLSACQTGLGKNFGVGTIGMARAWGRAGASSVVMSLWSVSDNATLFLMTQFVQLATEKPPDKALREAMQETRKEFPEPFNWAGFTIFGVPLE